MEHLCSNCGLTVRVMCDECGSFRVSRRIVWRYPEDPDNYERDTYYVCKECGWKAPEGLFDCDRELDYS